MTRRQFPALGADPAPGDPVALAAAAHQASTAAATFAGAAGRLTPVTWTGDAADAFRTTIGPLPTDLGTAADAHRTAAQALADYADGLRTRQLRADHLEAEAAALRAREATAIAEVNRLAGTRAPAGTAEFAALSADYSAARGRAATAGADLAHVLAVAKLLSEDHHAAARSAARILRAAGDTAPYEKPGLLSRALDRTKRWITDHADVLTNVSTVLKGVSTLLGTVSLIPGLQFLAPFAMAAGGLALALDVALKLSTGRGSWRTLALDTALTVLPTGRVTRAVKRLPHVATALRAVNRVIPEPVKGRLFRLGRNLPEGISREQAGQARTLIERHAAHYGDDVIVQGSHAGYRIRPTSDIDFGLRVDPDEFRRIVERRFGGTNAAPEHMRACLDKGIIHFRRAGLHKLQRELESLFGKEVDVSVVRRGGRFDPEPWLRLR